MLQLNSSVKYLKTVGNRRAYYLSQLGIHTVEELIFYFPREIQDRRNLQFLAQEIQPGKKITIVGKIVASQEVSTKNNLGIFKLLIETSLAKTPLVCLVWYKKLNRRYDVFSTLKRKFSFETRGKYVVAYGKINETGFYIPEVSVEDYELIEDINEITIHTNRLVPVYSLTENLSQQWFRELMFNTLQQIQLQEYLPQKILSLENLLPINIALQNIHFPDSWQLYTEAQKRFLFEKFFLLQIAVLKTKKQLHSKQKVAKYILRRTLLTPFKERLKTLISTSEGNKSFEFTKSQVKVINELFKDLLSVYPMNRILIGDVGSGKTIVAICCMLLAVENNYQVAFMAPTEILAEQHYHNLSLYLKNLFNPITKREVKISLYLGKTPKKEKEKILSGLKNGEIDIVVGTHSLIEPKVKFKNLSLVVIDEQHRFGVIQRKKLYQKSFLPDVLIMTATPIPRSLAMTVYGELDISTLTELPPGRKPIITKVYKSIDEVYQFLLQRLQQNEKIYIVYPIIEETKLELKTLVEEYAKLSSTMFKEYPCGILHGKMKPKQKEETMLKFKAGEYKILFTTTVIEVGIDVPDATVIVINHAERYGLAQLHQLRGRVGRSDKQSYCILICEPSTEEAKKRIQIMTETNDGFKIAQTDLLLRGPGEIFGVKQHGKTKFDFTEVIKYPEILSKAHEWAKKVVFTEEFKNVNLTELYKKIQQMYSKQFDLGIVG